jgi:hypothetical protein
MQFTRIKDSAWHKLLYLLIDFMIMWLDLLQISSVDIVIINTSNKKYNFQSNNYEVHVNVQY